LRRARRQELGLSRAAALAQRTKVLRRALAAHWQLADVLGGFAPCHGDALAAVRLLGAAPAVLIDAQFDLEEGNWARHAPPPGQARLRPVPTEARRAEVAEAALAQTQVLGAVPLAAPLALERPPGVWHEVSSREWGNAPAGGDAKEPSALSDFRVEPRALPLAEVLAPGAWQDFDLVAASAGQVFAQGVAAGWRLAVLEAGAAGEHQRADPYDLLLDALGIESCDGGSEGGGDGDDGGAFGDHAVPAAGESSPLLLSVSGRLGEAVSHNDSDDDSVGGQGQEHADGDAATACSATAASALSGAIATYLGVNEAALLRGDGDGGRAAAGFAELAVPTEDAEGEVRRWLADWSKVAHICSLQEQLGAAKKEVQLLRWKAGWLEIDSVGVRCRAGLPFVLQESGGRIAWHEF
jgi:hypothetical protein